MEQGWEIVCSSAEIAVEIARLGVPLGSPSAIVSAHPFTEAASRLSSGKNTALVLDGDPGADALVELAQVAAMGHARAALAILGAQNLPLALLDLASDLGIVAVDEVAPLLSAVALLELGAEDPWRASVRSLSAADRARLAHVVSSERGQGRFTREDDGLIGFAIEGPPAKTIGTARDVASALLAIRATATTPARPSLASIDVAPADVAAVRETLFGPARPLSDPASKRALLPYGVPLPLEELCTSSSRAAAEAARIGFPVRVSLASPDLRVWDHPDLCVDGIETGARVKDVFRQLMSLAGTRSKKARLLGMTVTRTTATRALVRLVVRPLAGDLVLAELGFADAHGLASGDHTHTVLPASAERIEQVLCRLAGSPLLLHGKASDRKRQVEDLADLLMRIGAFTNEHRSEVASVELDPIAVLVGGGVEVREACVEVSDAF